MTRSGNRQKSINIDMLAEVVGQPVQRFLDHYVIGRFGMPAFPESRQKGGAKPVIGEKPVQITSPHTTVR